MMNSKRSDGRRLILVIALIGILSTYGTSAQNNQVTYTAAPEESSESTAAVTGDQSTPEGADTSESQEVTTGASAGETATSPGETLPGGIGGGQTGNTLGETSIAEEGTVETPTSDGESSTAGRVSDRPGGGEAGVETSTGGTEGETTATFTGATSTDGPLGAVRQEETTGATTTEESLTTSVTQAAECNSTDTCETCETLLVDNRLTLNGSICKAEAEFQYCVNIELHDGRNPNRQRSHTSGSSHKVICSAVLNPLKEEVSKLRNKIRSRPRPTTSTTRSPPPPERKRRQANEATTSEPLDQLDWDDSDIDELWNATRIVVDKVAGGSGENMSTSESLTTSVKQTTATSTGATGTDGAGDLEVPLGAIQREETTGATTTEESLTTSVKQTSEAADAQYTTNVGDKSTERQTETTAPIKVTVPAVTLTIASTGCNSTVTCEDCGTIRVNNRLYYTGSICKAEAGFQYCVTIALHDRRNPNRQRSHTSGSSHEVNCSTVRIQIEVLAKEFINKIRNKTTTPRPTTSTVDPNPPAERKRRQANEATTSDPLDDLELDDSDIDELWSDTIRVIDKVAGGSGENNLAVLESSMVE